MNDLLFRKHDLDVQIRNSKENVKNSYKMIYCMMEKRVEFIPYINKITQPTHKLILLQLIQFIRYITYYVLVLEKKRLSIRQCILSYYESIIDKDEDLSIFKMRLYFGTLKYEIQLYIIDASIGCIINLHGILFENFIKHMWRNVIPRHCKNMMNKIGIIK